MNIALCPITNVRFAHLQLQPASPPETCLLAGAGSELRIYRLGASAPHLRLSVLPAGARIHGVRARSDGHLLLHGGRYLAHAVVVLHPAPHLQLVLCAELNEWVFNAMWLREADTLCAALGYGAVAVLAIEDLRCTSSAAPERKEMSWAAALHERADGDVLCAHGTTFGDIVLQVLRAMHTEASTRLQGHLGAVTRLRFSENGDALVSASVDRSVRVWAVRGSGAVAVRAHFGHRARVWDVAFTAQGSAVSVGEDRTARVWSSESDGVQTAAFRAHDGRNVWTVDVTHDGALLATAGDDGTVRLRSLPSGDEDLDGTDRGACVAFDLPGRYPNPRKSGGGATSESVRTMALLDDRVLLLSTDFGRVLRCTLSDVVSEQPEWDVLYRDVGGIAFAPNSLVSVGGLVLAGQTDGCVVVLPTARSEGCRNGSLDKAAAYKFPGTVSSGRMVMALFAAFDDRLDVAHVIVMSPHGEAMHWILNGTHSGATGAETSTILLRRLKCSGFSHFQNELRNAGKSSDCPKSSDGIAARRVGTYRHEALKRNMLGTCATYIACCRILLIGDRGGRISVYCADADERPHGDAGTMHPLCFCRPHSDRVTALEVLSSAAAGAGHCSHEILACAFDGRISRLQLKATRRGNHALSLRERCAEVAVLSSQRSIERVDTISKVFFPAGVRGDRARACVLGFRSTYAVMWDVAQRNQLFRSNCGNWRRAFAMHVELQEHGDKEGPLLVRNLVFAFWRAGQLFVESRGGTYSAAGADEDAGAARVHTIGSTFHGQRVNAVGVITAAHADDVSRDVYVMTAGEDTELRVMKLARNAEWETVQVLTQHISGVYGVSVARNSEPTLVSFSVGGCDEIIVWAAEKSEGPWRSVCEMGGDDVVSSVAEKPNRARSVANVDEDDAAYAYHRVLSVAAFPFGHCNCAADCSMAAIGRSDGSLSLIRCIPPARAANSSAMGWTSHIVSHSTEKMGAVMSVAVCQNASAFMVVSGDSTGNVCVWEISTDDACNARSARLMHRLSVHSGGVLSVDCSIVNGTVMCASGGDDGKVCAIQVRGRAVSVEQQLVSAGGVGGVCLHGDRIVAVAMCQGLWEWRVGVGSLSGQLEKIGCLEIGDGSDIAFCGDMQCVVGGHGLQRVSLAHTFHKEGAQWCDD